VDGVYDVGEEAMTPTEREKINRTIHEAKGLCWHDFTKRSHWCDGCGRWYYDIYDSVTNEIFSPLPDYTTDAALLPLWRWAQGQGILDAWTSDCAQIREANLKRNLNVGDRRDPVFVKGMEWIPTIYIDQPRFAQELAEWLNKEEI
jgi:hypothetical protein